MCVRKTLAKAFLQGQFVERGAVVEVAVPPSRVERIGVLLEPERLAAFRGDGPKAMLAVEVVNAVNGGEFVPALPGVGAKLQRSRSDYGMACDKLGDLEISFEILVGHELYIAEARESLAADSVACEVVLKFEFESG